MGSIGRVWIFGALVVGVAGCAQPSQLGSDDAGPGIGGNGADVDLAQPPASPDLAPPLRCGDGVCSASIGESCSTCMADCGNCPGCPMGYADCDHNPNTGPNGCETPLDTVDNCGGCGTVCQMNGGTNACVQSGNAWVCQPTCDATHADCNMMPDDGCETATNGPANCGACGKACMNPNGTTACAASGQSWACDPTCTPPYAACAADKTAGCTTNTNNDTGNCGACGRACSTKNATSTSCSGAVCHPVCAAPYSDCSDPAAPGADDGCETNGTADPGENDNACSGQYSNTNEGGTTTITTNRILPSGDTDTFHVHATEGSHVCFPGTAQSYTALIQLTPPPGVNLNLNYNTSGCDNTWKNDLGTGICVTWCGTCSATDDRDWYFQVYGVNGANACLNYTLTITYASEGNAPAGCTKPSC